MITPYYEETSPNGSYRRIYNCDCRDLMREMADQSIPFTLTDSPYGVGVEYDSYSDTPEELKTLIATAMPEILRVSVRTMITTGVQYCFEWPKPTWIIPWVSRGNVGCGPWGFCCWQPILCYGGDPFLADALGSQPDTIELQPDSQANGHPCPKPLNVRTAIARRGLRQSDKLMFDPFVGSGTTLRVAKNFGLSAIGCDLSRAYCDIAIEILAQGAMHPEGVYTQPADESVSFEAAQPALPAQPSLFSLSKA